MLAAGIIAVAAVVGFGASYLYRHATSHGLSGAPPTIATAPVSTTPTTTPYRASATGMHGEALAVNGLFGNDVVPIDLTTGTVGKPIPVPITPVQVLVTPDGRTAYAFGLESSSIVPIDLATRTAMPPISLSASPNDVALSPDGTRLYATVGNNSFVILDARSGQVLSTIDVPAGVGSIVVSHNGTTAYVDASGSSFEQSPDFYSGGDTITSINLAARKVGATFTLPAPANIFAISNDDTVLYASASPTSGNGPPSFLYEINVSTGALGTPEPMTDSLNNFDLAPSGTTAYIDGSGDNDVVPMNLSTFAIGHPIAVGQNPSQAAFSGNGTYMVIGTLKGVVVVDLATGHVDPPIPLPPSGTTITAKAASGGAIGVALVPNS